MLFALLRSYGLAVERNRYGRSHRHRSSRDCLLIALCDRILVLCGGRVSGIVDGRSITKEEIGLLMTKTDFDEDKKEV